MTRAWHAESETRSKRKGVNSPNWIFHLLGRSEKSMQNTTETNKPAFKGSIQIRDPTTPTGYKTIGAVKLYIRVPKDGEAPNSNLPSLKGYVGINDKEFYEVSLWETT
jgi:hypothetical protein